MDATALGIITTILSSGSLVTLIIFLVQRHDTKNDDLKELCNKVDELKTENNKKFKKLEKDIVRTQLLQLMQSYDSEDEHELMQVAEHYFSKEHLAANWYMTTKFNRFMQKNKIAKPEWFNK